MSRFSLSSMGGGKISDCATGCGGVGALAGCTVDAAVDAGGALLVPETAAVGALVEAAALPLAGNAGVLDVAAPADDAEPLALESDPFDDAELLAGPLVVGADCWPVATGQGAITTVTDDEGAGVDAAGAAGATGGAGGGAGDGAGAVEAGGVDGTGAGPFCGCVVDCDASCSDVGTQTNALCSVAGGCGVGAGNPGPVVDGGHAAPVD